MANHPVAGENKLYGELAPWFHLLTAPEDYADEAAFYRDVLVDAAEGSVEAVLELGSGGGNNASHLKQRFSMTLTDRSPEMLAVSETLNPECEHIVADMRSMRLGRTFDAVFAHDAVAYITDERDLLASVQTAFEHCRPGGVALFAPDFLRETFRPHTGHGGHDGGDRGLRYVDWVWDPDPGDTSYIVDFAYLLREGEEVRVEQDRHVCGAFARATWLEQLRTTGFRPEVRATPWGGEEEGAEVLLGTRPYAATLG
jgi:SAM-dependent methyltransferase